MKDKDIQNALEKINDDLVKLYAEIFADSVMDSKLDARRANLRCAVNGAIIKLQWAEGEIN